MTTDLPDIEPLSGAAQSLLAAERADAGAPPPDVAERVLARVQATVSAPVGPATANASVVAAPAAAVAPAAGVSSGVTVGVVIGLALAGLSVVVAPPLRDHGARTVPALSLEAPAEPAASAPARPATKAVRRAPVRRGPLAAAAPRTAPSEAAQPAVLETAPARPAPTPVAPAPPKARSEPAAAPAATPPAAEAPDLKPARGSVRGDKPAPRRPRRDLAAERILLDAARTSLSRGDTGQALAKVREHRDEWPLGALRQEREALWVRALKESGLGEAAKRRGERFLRKHPDSIHRTSVESALDGL